MRDKSTRLLAELVTYITELEKENCEILHDLEHERQARWAAADSLRRYTDKELDSADLQLACMALAELVLHRPGLDYAVSQVAEKLGGVVAERHIKQFKRTSADLCKPYDLLPGSKTPQDDPTAGG